MRMDLRAFGRNYTRARQIARGPKDQLRYLGWLYGVPRSPRSSGVELRLRLPSPVGEVTLTMRPNQGSDAFIFSEVFEHRYYDFELGYQPETILDLGANIGLTALFFARKYPQAKIACVEPMPGNVKLLRNNLEQNAVPATVFPKAVSVRDEPVVMQMADNDYGHKVSEISYGRTLDGETLGVDGISVPTLLAELNWHRIALLKVDIEGYEGVLLRDQCDWLRRVDAICIECHEGYGDNDLKDLASRFGFAEPRHLEGTVLLVRG